MSSLAPACLRHTYTACASSTDACYTASSSGTTPRHLCLLDSRLLYRLLSGTTPRHLCLLDRRPLQARRAQGCRRRQNLSGERGQVRAKQARQRRAGRTGRMSRRVPPTPRPPKRAVNICRDREVRFGPSRRVRRGRAGRTGRMSRWVPTPRLPKRVGATMWPHHRADEAPLPRAAEGRRARGVHREPPPSPPPGRRSAAVQRRRLLLPGADAESNPVQICEPTLFLFFIFCTSI